LIRNFDVIIVGAGPAGSTVAYEIARKGLKVAVLEKESLPRYKCCAGGLSVKALKLLKTDISESIEAEIRGVAFTLKGEQPHIRQESRPVGYTVRRDKFDHLLALSAEKAGARLFPEHKVHEIHTDKRGIQLSTSKGTFNTRLLVGADGALGIVARSLGFENKIRDFLAVQVEVVVNASVMRRWNSQITIDLGRLYGYAWVFPKSDHLSIGIDCHHSQAKSLQRHLADFLASLDLGSYTVTRRRGGLIPLHIGKLSAVKGRALLVGDACGLADPMTGEGIHNAIFSAQLASEVITRTPEGNPEGLMDYQDHLEKQILLDLKAARFIANIFYKLPALSYSAIRRDNRIWATGCNLMRGETNFTSIKKRLNTLGGIKRFLLNQ
jgi:geranylgeranyl reductase family protein